MSIKGFSSSFHAVTVLYNGVKRSLNQVYVTVRDLGAGKVGLMTSPMWLSTVVSINALVAGSTTSILNITGHSIRKGDILRFTSGANSGIEVQAVDVSDVNSILIGQVLPNTPSTDSFSHLRPMSPTLGSTGQLQIVEGTTTVVDFMDQGSMVPTGGSLIPRSSNAPLLIVASLAAPVTQIQVVSDVGEFMNLYSDAAGANLISHVPLTPDGLMDVELAAGTAVYLGASKDVDISDASSIISMNFIG